MQAYLAAHDHFVTWIDSLEEVPPPAEVEERLRALAVAAAARGMNSVHWTFVVDGLIAHLNRHRPGDMLLSSIVARGFDLAARWEDMQSQATDAGEARSQSRRAR